MSPPLEVSEQQAQRARQSGDAFIPQPSDGFVVTPEVDRITQRSLAYLESGYPVHFAGVPGTGKTTLAFHVAAKIGRPTVLLHGDDEFSRSDLVGSSSGYKKSKVVDNFIHSVLKTEEEAREIWVDNRLLKACREGHTLIYDEFTRSKPEANNVLLSVLEERVLNLPTRSGPDNPGYIEVHPDFCAIFTSNPQEYAGVHETQSALLDRLISIQLDFLDRETELDIAVAKSELDRSEAERVIDVVYRIREVLPKAERPTIRGVLAVARVMSTRGKSPSNSSEFFLNVCWDVLVPVACKADDERSDELQSQLADIIEDVCS